MLIYVYAYISTIHNNLHENTINILTMKTTIKDIQMIDYGYNHLEPGHPDNTKGFRICGSPTTSENARTSVCQNPAGFKTGHVGMGHCHLHGGRNKMGIEAPGYKTGRYAKLYQGRLQKYFEVIGNDNTNPLDLVPELQVQRVMLSLALDKLDEAPLQPQLVNQCKHKQSGTLGTIMIVI